MYIFRNQTSPFSSFSIFLSTPPPKRGRIRRVAGVVCRRQTKSGTHLQFFSFSPFSHDWKLKLVSDVTLRCTIKTELLCTVRKRQDCCEEQLKAIPPNLPAQSSASSRAIVSLLKKKKKKHAAFKDKDHNVGGKNAMAVSRCRSWILWWSGGEKSGKCKTAGERNFTIKIAKIDQIESSTH